jgi:hypothetical protein
MLHLRQQKKNTICTFNCIVPPLSRAVVRNRERTKKLLRYLVVKKGLAPVTLSELLDNLRKSGSMRSFEVGKISFNRKSVIQIPRTREDVIGCVPNNGYV